MHWKLPISFTNFKIILQSTGIRQQEYNETKRNPGSRTKLITVRDQSGKQTQIHSSYGV